MLQSLAMLDRVAHYETMQRNFDANQKKLYDTERLLARSEKIASMAGLIQEYNHEIRTPLAIMSSKILSLPDDAKELGDFKEIKEYFQKQISRASDIVDSTLRLSKPKERHEIDLDLNEVIENALTLYQPIGAEVVKELNSLPIIKGDFEDLKLVFINLIKNAREAIPDKGTITIRTAAARENDAPLVVAEVSDTGVGIPKENLDKIFEPFFSTNVTKGRGLGLSIVFRIVREHLGSIEVKSQPGQGATFILKFPAQA
jgi:signal transduction histidine kinase